MICNADVSAESSSEGLHQGSGIGTGSVESGTSTIKTLMIWNSNIIAKASSNLSGTDDDVINSGSGIGTGKESKGTSKIGTVMIWNVNITAEASSDGSTYSLNYGSGIGTGQVSGEGTSKIGTVMIWNVNIIAEASSDASESGTSSSNSGSGIGTGGVSGCTSKIGTIGYPTPGVAWRNLTNKKGFDVWCLFRSPDVLSIAVDTLLQSVHPLEENRVQCLPRDFCQNYLNADKKLHRTACLIAHQLSFHISEKEEVGWC
jgi:hypothetical protein